MVDGTRRGAARGWRVLTPGGADYPPSLAVLGERPALWLAGAVPPGTGAVAVVGTRHPTPDGVALARLVAGTAAARGLAVVSGLAPGVDTEAHRAALDAGGSTWAVVGCGVDVALSGRGGRLAREMVAAGGGVLAEVPPGTRPTAAARVARDRIQTALGEVCVVVQTDLASGTMHTARFALEQGRRLVVVRPPPAGPVLPAAAWAGNAAISGWAPAARGILDVVVGGPGDLDWLGPGAGG